MSITIRSDDSSAFKGVKARSKIFKLARRNPINALGKTRDIEHPWYRIQCYGAILRWIDEAKLDTVYSEAKIYMVKVPDKYNAVGSGAWICAGLRDRGEFKKLRDHVDYLLKLRHEIWPPGSKAYALMTIFDGVIDEKTDCWKKIWEALIDDSFTKMHHRQRQAAYHIFPYIHYLDEEYALATLERIEDSRIRRSVMRKVPVKSIYIKKFF